MTITSREILPEVLDVTKTRRRRRRGSSRDGNPVQIGLANIFLWAYAVVAVGPLVFMVTNSFRTQEAIASDPLGLPLPPTLDNYQEAWLTASFDTYFLNSILVTVGSVALTTLVSLPAAYAFARSRSKFFAGIEAVYLAGLMLPVNLAILPLFYLLNDLQLTSNIGSLILVYGAGGIPFTTFVLALFFRQMPKEVEEAALLDGASPVQTFVRVLLPLVRPAIATVVVFRFVPIWNDFFYPLILIRNSDAYTLPVGLTRFFGQYSTDWAQLFAGLSIATVPLIVLFLLATKQIISGLTSGMTK